MNDWYIFQFEGEKNIIHIQAGSYLKARRFFNKLFAGENPQKAKFLRVESAHEVGELA